MTKIDQVYPVIVTALLSGGEWTVETLLWKVWDELGLEFSAAHVRQAVHRLPSGCVCKRGRFLNAAVRYFAPTNELLAALHTIYAERGYEISDRIPVFVHSIEDELCRALVLNKRVLHQSLEWANGFGLEYGAYSYGMFVRLEQAS
jgi:hypothetical protein